MKKLSSLRTKLLLICGILTGVTILLLSSIGIITANKLLVGSMEDNLSDSSMHIAELISSRIQETLCFLEGIASIHALGENTYSPQEKSAMIGDLNRPAAIQLLSFADTGGNVYLPDGTINASHQDWFSIVMSGKSHISEPFTAVENGELISVCAVPVFNAHKQVVGAVNAIVSGLWISELFKDTLSDKYNAYGFVVNKEGTTIADLDTTCVLAQENIIRQAQSDPTLTDMADFVRTALSDPTDRKVVTYKWEGNEGEETLMATYAQIPNTEWMFILEGEKHVALERLIAFRSVLFFVGLGMLFIVLAVVWLAVNAIVKPLNKVMDAAKDIAEGGGDLTVRLPVRGNDEVANLSHYFNQTMEKIADSIRSVGHNATALQNIGGELARNMSETASAIHEISANVEGVKQQTVNQSTSVSETAGTIEQIIRIIKQLNGSIENQSASVAASSSVIEEMVANITSITYTLDQTNDVVKQLASATEDGKSTVATANMVTQKIAEESGVLLEASSVIQHIASQTNLLAMNAAIEAAHAGDAGKGFAVVADEIRKLAEESSLQGKTITSTLKTLSGEIDTLSSAANVVEEKFNAIFSLSEQVKSMSAQLMEAMKEQEKGSHEVLTSIQDINAVTSEVHSGSAEMLRGGEGIAQEMRKLDDLTRVITDSMNEMAAGAVELGNAVQEVDEISQKNKQSIDNLVIEVRKFKI